MKKIIVLLSIIFGATPITSAMDEALLIEKIKGGVSVDEVSELLRDGADIDAQDKNGVTALMYVSKCGKIEMVEKLLAPNQTKPQSSLYSLVWSPEKIQGAEVDAQDRYKNTALMYAANNSNIDIVETLINSDADINVVSACGNSPLTCAAQKRDLVLYELLAGNGASEDKKNRYGKTAHDYAIESGLALIKAAKDGNIPSCEKILNITKKLTEEHE